MYMMIKTNMNTNQIKQFHIKYQCFSDFVQWTQDVQRGYEHLLRTFAQLVSDNLRSRRPMTEILHLVKRYS